MRTIKLHLESLAVESFATTLPDFAAGTIAAHQLATPFPCEYESGSCLNSCEGTCSISCGGTCDGSCAGDPTCIPERTCDGACPIPPPADTRLQNTLCGFRPCP
jgi:hypothetical protein